jgi:hypothetical protein
VTIPAAFARIATAFSAAGLGPYQPSVASWPGVPVEDDGGSIITPGTPVEKTCYCQVDQVTEDMRAEAGYRDKDVALLILCDTLDGELDTDATINVTKGPNAGLWSVQSVSKDSMGTHWLCRGRQG